MSYNISFKVKVEGADAYVDVGACSANVTWNVRTIIELSTGLPWMNEPNNGRCLDVIPKIRHGLESLRTHPERYRPYEADNGWGTVEGTIHFFEQILKDWDELRASHEDLAAVATFWVE